MMVVLTRHARKDPPAYEARGPLRMLHAGPTYATGEDRQGNLLVDVLSSYGHRCCMVDRHNVLHRQALAASHPAACRASLRVRPPPPLACNGSALAARGPQHSSLEHAAAGWAKRLA